MHFFNISSHNGYGNSRALEGRRSLPALNRTREIKVLSQPRNVSHLERWLQTYFGGLLEADSCRFLRLVLVAGVLKTGS